MKCLAVPNGALLDLKVIVVAVDRDRVSGVSLQLDRVGTSFLSGVYDFSSGFQFSAVVSRHFSNHVDIVSCSDWSVVDFHVVAVIVAK